MRTLRVRGLTGLARRFLAAATALAVLSLLAPPAAAGSSDKDCCEQSCNGVCCLLMERVGLGHQHDHGTGGQEGDSTEEPSWKSTPKLDRSSGACPAAGASAGVQRPAPAGVSSRSDAPKPPAASAAAAGHRAAVYAALRRGSASPRGPPLSPRT